MALLRRAVERTLPGDKLSPEAAALVYRGIYAWRDFSGVRGNQIQRASNITRYRSFTPAYTTAHGPGTSPSIMPVTRTHETRLLGDSRTDGSLQQYVAEINEKAQRVRRIERVARYLKWSMASIVAVGFLGIAVAKAPLRESVRIPDCPVALGEGLAVVPTNTYEGLGIQIAEAIKKYRSADYATRNEPGGIGDDEIAVLQQNSQTLGFESEQYVKGNTCLMDNEPLVKVPERTWLETEDILTRTPAPTS